MGDKAPADFARLADKLAGAKRVLNNPMSAVAERVCRIVTAHPSKVRSVKALNIHKAFA